jgi:hypothetical protein
VFAHQDKLNRGKINLCREYTHLFFVCYSKVKSISGACGLRNLKALNLEEATVTFPIVPTLHSLGGGE